MMLDQKKKKSGIQNMDNLLICKTKICGMVNVKTLVGVGILTVGLWMNLFILPTSLFLFPDFVK